MLRMLSDEALGFTGAAVAFMAGAFFLGVSYNAVNSIGQAAVDNVINRVRK